MAFGKWEKVERNIAPAIISKDYLSVKTEISSYFFLPLSNVEAAKVCRSIFLFSKEE